MYCEVVHVECEVESHGPTILGVVVVISKDLGRLRRIRVLSLLQRCWYHRQRAHLNGLNNSRFLHVVPRPFGWRELYIGSLGLPSHKGHCFGCTSKTSSPRCKWFPWTLLLVHLNDHTIKLGNIYYEGC